MKYNSIGQQLIAKAKEIDPSYKPDKFNDMSEALNIILNNLDTYATFNDLHTLDIGDITSSSNIYQTLYQNVYENDTTKKNVVIFSTDGFVDSATSLISSGEHIATPYQDNKILIDSVFVLNSDNSATSIVSSDTVVIDLGTVTEISGTLSPTILTEINNAISENKNILLKIDESTNEIVLASMILKIANTLDVSTSPFVKNSNNYSTICLNEINTANKVSYIHLIDDGKKQTSSLIELMKENVKRD